MDHRWSGVRAHIFEKGVVVVEPHPDALAGAEDPPSSDSENEQERRDDPEESSAIVGDRGSRRGTTHPRHTVEFGPPFVDARVRTGPYEHAVVWHQPGQRVDFPNWKVI